MGQWHLSKKNIFPYCKTSNVIWTLRNIQTGVNDAQILCFSVCLSVCQRTSVAGDDGLSMLQVAVVAITHSIWQLVVLSVFLGVEDVLPAVSTCLKHTHTHTGTFSTQHAGIMWRAFISDKHMGGEQGSVVVLQAHMTELCVCVRLLCVNTHQQRTAGVNSFA